ncbi:MAG TPA: glycerol-3-phosphate dehydrogenase/oxidase [Methylomirabilota bacterium]|nr:glycerol-3-phosphate dehydrogenase/oxidase [Methylomirabilota bacterium]
MSGPERDLLVLGGGVTGLGIARLAARSGWSVTVVERDDLATGASSATSHMLHGGLRYLEHGRFRLVREALAERMAVSRLAPALARPVRFLVPLRKGDRVGPLRLRAGLALYDLLSGRAGLSPYALANARQALALEPGLEPEGLRAAGIYSDVVMDDARLTMAVARDAAAHGAEILTHTELVAARPEPSTGRQVVEVRARVAGGVRSLKPLLIVNATGAWGDRTRATLLGMLQPGRNDPPRMLRPSRGTHLVYPALTEGHALVTLAADGRVCFVIPFAGRSLVGTTEVETDSPPADGQRRATPDEIRYIAREVARVVPGAARVHPIAVYAGVRPLLAAEERVGQASREHRIVDDGPLLTIAGGKYTTFRVMARDVFVTAARKLKRATPPADDAGVSLPAPLADSVRDEDLAAHAIEHEWAHTLEDIVRRRSMRWLADDRGLAAARRMAPVLAQRLGWDATREKEEIDRFEASVRDELVMLDRALAAH